MVTPSLLMYLSASDGSIEVAEAIFIKDYFMEQISPEEICQRIEEDNLYSASFGHSKTTFRGTTTNSLGRSFAVWWQSAITF